MTTGTARANMRSAIAEVESTDDFIRIVYSTGNKRLLSAVDTAVPYCHAKSKCRDACHALQLLETRNDVDDRGFFDGRGSGSGECVAHERVDGAGCDGTGGFA